MTPARDDATKNSPQNGNKVYELDDGSELIMYSTVCICGNHFNTVDGTRRRCLWCKAKAEIEGEA